MNADEMNPVVRMVLCLRMSLFISGLICGQVLCGQTPQPPPTRTTPFGDANASVQPNLPTQKIGANDLISVSVYDAPEFTRTIRVGADGRISLPLMKRSILAAGLLPAEVESKLAEALKDQNLLNDATVIVTVAEYNSRPVTVNGSVHNPLTFQVIGKVRLMDAITRAGGLTPDAGPEALISEPNSEKPALLRRIPLKTLLDSTDPDLNIELEGGQEVRIPAAGRIFVLGNVKTAGAFAIQDESDTTVLKILTLAGGLASVAPKEAYIVRSEGTNSLRHQIPIPLKDIINRRIPDPPLQAHDILFIPTNKAHDNLEILTRIISVGASSAVFATVLR